jgi:ABC-type amino acid transport substrate-binding protein
MKRLVSLLMVMLILVPLLAACGKTESEDELAAIKESGLLKVGISADYPPYQFVDTSGQFTGFDVDLTKEIADRLGVKVEYVDVPFDTLFTALQEGKFDIAAGSHMKTAEREAVMEFPRAHWTTKNAMLVQDSFDCNQLKTVEDIGKFVVGEQTGGIEEKFMRETLVDKGLLPADNLKLYERVDSLAQEVKAGRVDMAMNKIEVWLAYVKELGGLKLCYVPGLVEGGVYMSFKKGEAGLRDAVDKIIGDLQNEGWLDEQAKKYNMTE